MGNTTIQRWKILVMNFLNEKEFQIGLSLTIITRVIIQIINDINAVK